MFGIELMINPTANQRRRESKHYNSFPLISQQYVEMQNKIKREGIQFWLPNPIFELDSYQTSTSGTKFEIKFTNFEISSF